MPVPIVVNESSVKPMSPLLRNRKDGSLLVRVPAGDFVMGDGTEGDHPEHRVWLDAFYIGIFCVTNARYARFVREGGGKAPGNARWQRPDLEHHPVVNVSWEDASAYAAWAGLSLPTEAQWEKAARGPLGLIYPWGGDWLPARCACAENKGVPGQTMAVGALPEGVGGYGSWQQAGNVMEWCADAGAGERLPLSLGQAPEGPRGGHERVFRGGSWIDPAVSCRCSHRSLLDPVQRSHYLGFRVVMGPVPG